MLQTDVMCWRCVRAADCSAATYLLPQPPQPLLLLPAAAER
jgi:hypothetical protein